MMKSTAALILLVFLTLNLNIVQVVFGAKDFEIEVLERHNKLRKDHGVPPLTLDKKLSRSAQAWADELAKTGAFEHSDSGAGENLYKGTTGWKTGKQVVDAWYSEIEDYKFGKEPRGDKTVGHFTQIVWKNSKRLGVGKAKSKIDGKTVVVCQYDPAGNMRGRYSANVPPPKH